MQRSFLSLVLILTAIGSFTVRSRAQTHDYMTPEEIEVIRDAQAIDDRMDVLIHMIDRRFVVLGIDPGRPDTKKPNKPEKEDKWGPPPAGTRMQILNDIKLLIQKAVDDIDNLAERPDSMYIDQDKEKKKRKGYSELFPKAVRSLAAASQRYQPLLTTELDKAETDGQQKGIVLAALDLTDQIIESVSRLPK